MKHAIRFITAFSLALFVAFSVNAQSASATVSKGETKKCQAKISDAAMCDMMVKAGLCTKAQVEACKAKGASASTQVAAASMEKVDGEVVPSADEKSTKKASCLKKCMKTCQGKRKPKAE